MITHNTLKSKNTLSFLLSALISSGVLASPALASDSEIETAVAPAPTANAPVTGKAKIALVPASLAAGAWTVPLSAQAVKVKHNLGNYAEIENYSYSSGADLTGSGF